MTALETEQHAREHNLTSIQCLRGVAATMVVLFHAIGHGLHAKGDVAALPLAGGVDIFFVISGFIMFYSFHRSPGRSGARFLLDRLIRIGPMYWLLSLIVVAIALAMPALLQSGRFDAIHAALSFLFIPWRHPVSGLYEPILIPGWTLNYEMFFYLIFAAGIGLAGGRIVRLFWLVAPAIALIAFLPRIVPVAGIASFYTAGIILEFAYGLIVCRIFLSGRRLSPMPCALFLLAGIVAFVALPALAPTLPRALMFGGPALLTFIGAVYLPLDPRRPAIRFLKLLGDASYSLYLLHPLGVSAIGQVWRRGGFDRLPGGAWLFAPVATLACAVAAFLLYRWVEQPLVEISKRLTRNRPNMAPAQFQPS